MTIDFGMLTEEGNARVQEIVADALLWRVDGTGFIRIGDRLLTREEYALERLDALSLDPEFTEAYDARVTHAVREVLR